MVKNLFGLPDVYLQVFMKRLTPVIRTRLFLKLTFSDKNRLVGFHLFMNKESCFAFSEMHKGVVTLIHYLSLPIDGFCQPTVANRQLFATTFLMLGPKPIVANVNQS
jgi:hypothetical protein